LTALPSVIPAAVAATRTFEAFGLQQRLYGLQVPARALHNGSTQHPVFLPEELTVIRMHRWRVAFLAVAWRVGQPNTTCHASRASIGRRQSVGRHSERGRAVLEKDPAGSQPVYRAKEDLAREIERSVRQGR
jgi:hypothetical protein